MLLTTLRVRCDLLKIIINLIKRFIINNDCEINAEIVIIIDINLLIIIKNVMRFSIILIF